MSEVIVWERAITVLNRVVIIDKLTVKSVKAHSSSKTFSLVGRFGYLVYIYSFKIKFM